jgi:hypothetical protein
MKIRSAAILLAFAAVGPAFPAADAPPSRPMAGPVEIMKLNDVKPGMKGGVDGLPGHGAGSRADRDCGPPASNQNGPNQDIIVAKMFGKAKVTNVAGGMSGSPVYIDGKLVGAVALRMSTFSPDAICGITPIELMLEINDLDNRGRKMRARPTRRASRNGAVSPVRRLLGNWRPAWARAAALGHDGPDRIAADAHGLLRQRAARVRPDVPANGRQRGAGGRRQRHPQQQARARMGACAQPRRKHRGRAGGWRHEPSPDWAR